MKILVVGTGFIGSKIVEKLSDEHEVKTLDRSSGDFTQDITEEFEISESFDVMYHTVGLAPGMFMRRQYQAVHVKGTQNLLDAVETDKIVYLSALGVGKVDHSFFETKEKAENLIKESETDYTIVRPSTVYGGGNKLLEDIRKISKFRTFPSINTLTQPIHIDDLTVILVKAKDDFENETLEVAGPEKMTVTHLAKKIFAEEGRSCTVLPVPQVLQETGLKLSPFGGPFSRENVELLRQQNTTDENDAERILENLTGIL